MSTQEITPAVNNTQAQAFMQSLSPEQLRILMGAVAPSASEQDALSTVVESLADRLAGNGLTADMAGYWANQLDTFVGDKDDESVSAVKGAVNFLRRAGHVNAADAARVESDLRDWVNTNKNQPKATVTDVTDVTDVIDTTAKHGPSSPVMEPQGFQSRPQGTSGEVPGFNTNPPSQ